MSENLKGDVNRVVYGESPSFEDMAEEFDKSLLEEPVHYDEHKPFLLKLIRLGYKCTQRYNERTNSYIFRLEKNKCRTEQWLNDSDMRMIFGERRFDMNFVMNVVYGELYRKFVDMEV